YVSRSFPAPATSPDLGTVPATGSGLVEDRGGQGTPALGEIGHGTVRCREHVEARARAIPPPYSVEWPGHPGQRGAHVRLGLGSASPAGAPPTLSAVRHPDPAQGGRCGRSLGLRTRACHPRSPPNRRPDLDGPGIDPAGPLQLRRPLRRGPVARPPGAE